MVLLGAEHLHLLDLASARFVPRLVGLATGPASGRGDLTCGAPARVGILAHLLLDLRRGVAVEVVVANFYFLHWPKILPTCHLKGQEFEMIALSANEHAVSLMKTGTL